MLWRTADTVWGPSAAHRHMIWDSPMLQKQSPVSSYVRESHLLLGSSNETHASIILDSRGAAGPWGSWVGSGVDSLGSTLCGWGNLGKDPISHDFLIYAIKKRAGNLRAAMLRMDWSNIFKELNTEQWRDGSQDRLGSLMLALLWVIKEVWSVPLPSDLSAKKISLQNHL